MAHTLAAFLRKHNVCGPSISFADTYTGPENEIITACADIEWALLIAILAVHANVLEVVYVSDIVNACVAAVPGANGVKAAATRVMEAQNPGAQRVRAVTVLRDASRLLMQYKTPVLITHVCEIIQKHVDVTKFA